MPLLGSEVNTRQTTECSINYLVSNLPYSPSMNSGFVQTIISTPTLHIFHFSLWIEVVIGTVLANRLTLHGLLAILCKIGTGLASSCFSSFLLENS